MKKFSLFDFLNRRIETAEISTVTQKILDQLAFKELALYIGISYIANTLSKCEFKTYENGKEVKNKLYYMLNVSPNPNQNSSQFINKFIENYYYKGHALIVPHGNHIFCADNFDVDDSNPLKENLFQKCYFTKDSPGWVKTNLITKLITDELDICYLNIRTIDFSHKPKPFIYCSLSFMTIVKN